MKPTCPAAELTHGTLSLNRLDARCRISGMIRDAEGSPCCGAYVDCPIWRVEKDRIASKGKANKADKMVHAGTGAWE